MILPTEFLAQVEYYECTTVKNFEGYSTEITLHFKQWWRRRKVFRFKWDRVSIDYRKSTWKEDSEAAELRLQLSKHFRGINQND